MNICIWKDSLLTVWREICEGQGWGKWLVHVCVSSEMKCWRHVNRHKPPPQGEMAAEGDKQKAESPGGSQTAWHTRAGENSLLTRSHFSSLVHSFWRFFFRCHPIKLNTTLKVTLRKPEATEVSREVAPRSSELMSFLVFPQPTISRVAWHRLL